MAQITQKQKQFCEEYIIDLNARQAAIRAGYSEKTAEVQASRLLTKAKVQEYISLLKGKRQERTEVTQDMVVMELAKIAFINADDFYDNDGSIKSLNDLDSKTRGALKSYQVKTVKIGDDYEEVAVHQSHDKIKALELLGKHLGIFEKDNNQKDSNQSLTIEIV